MPTSSTKDELIQELIRNNITLQTKTADLISSIKELTGRLNKMVVLFEEAAAHIKAGTDEPMIRRLDELLDQNKSLAKGLLLLEKYVREKAAQPPPSILEKPTIQE